MSEGVFPFRRMTKALLVPVATTATSFQVPSGLIKPDYNAFCIVNPNVCWVGLRGTSAVNNEGQAPTEAIMASQDGDDWLFNPGHFGVYTTQHPFFMSAIALSMPGYELPDTFVPLRLYYGYGA